MNEIRLYKMLKQFRHRLTRLQYITIKGQIRTGDLDGAYKGIKKIIGGTNENIN